MDALKWLHLRLRPPERRAPKVLSSELEASDVLCMDEAEKILEFARCDLE